MHERHPQLFDEAKKYEKFDPVTGAKFTWSQGESLDELLGRADAIKHAANKKLKSIAVVTLAGQTGRNC